MSSTEALAEMSKNLGAEIPPFLFDGDIKRFKDSKGKLPFWGIGREWEYKGNIYITIKYGDWRTGKTLTWKNYNLKEQTKSFSKKEKAVWQEMAEKEKKEKAEKNQNCIKAWKPKFKTAIKTKYTHEYLEKKGIKSNHNAKIDHNGTLLIPSYDHEKFVGCQIIFKSEETNKYVKRFSTGIALQGSFCPIGKFKTSNTIYIAEGFATAATIYELTKIPCMVVWSCNNMFAAIQTIRKINPNCNIIIAADKDTKKESKDISIKKAYYCKNRLANIIVKVPSFESFDSNMTDFNDLLQVEGEEITREQLSFSSSEFIEIECIGHKEGRYFYFNSQTREMRTLTIAEHNKNNLLAMAEGKYWGDRYKFKVDKDGDNTDYPDFDYAIEQMFKEQREKGLYDPKRIRGTGTWIDGDNIVVNLGDKKIINGEIGEIQSKYFYQASNQIEVDLDNPLTDEECKKMIKMFSMFNYKNEGDYIYMTGWIALAHIFGAIDWRFQIWVTGEKGSGKTEILKIMSKFIDDDGIYQSVTQAGIRQKLKIDSKSLLIDEAESNDKIDKNRMQGVMELIRRSSSLAQTKDLRGTASGDVIETSVSALFCLSSIQTFIKNSADESRFFEIEMLKNTEKNAQNWVDIQDMFSSMHNYGPRLLARMIKVIPVLKKNIKTIKDLLVKSEMLPDARSADQIGTAIACHFALLSTKEIANKDMATIVKLVKKLDLGQSDYEMRNEDDEGKACLNTILELSIGNSKSTVNNCIQKIKGNPSKDQYLQEELAFFGMRYFIEDDTLFIPAKNLQLSKQLNETMYSDHTKVLKRSDDFVKYKACRIDGILKKGAFMSLKKEEDNV